MAYSLVRLSALSGKDPAYTVVGTDLVYTTLGTGEGAGIGGSGMVLIE